jgi:hypothetical protein
MLAYKKRLIFAKQARISNYFTYFYFGILVLLVLPAFHWFIGFFSEYQFLELSKAMGNATILLMIFVTAVIGIFAGLLSQYAYSNEKISVLTPWDQSFQLWVIVLGYFFAQGSTGIVSVVCAIVAALSIIVGNLEKGKFLVNKPCLALGGTALLRAIATLLLASVVKDVSAGTIVFTENVFSSAYLLVYLVATGGILGMKKSDVLPFTRVSLGNVTLWLTGFIITLLLFKELGVVFTSLLSMLTVVLILAVNWIAFRDRPAKKEMLVSATIIACVTIGATFR